MLEPDTRHNPVHNHFILYWMKLLPKPPSKSTLISFASPHSSLNETSPLSIYFPASSQAAGVKTQEHILEEPVLIS